MSSPAAAEEYSGKRQPEDSAKDEETAVSNQQTPAIPRCHSIGQPIPSATEMDILARASTLPQFPATPPQDGMGVGAIVELPLVKQPSQSLTSSPASAAIPTSASAPDLQASRISFPSVVGLHGAEVHLYDGLVSCSSHEVVLLRRGFYGLRLRNLNEAAWDSLYLGIGKMRMVAEFTLEREIIEENLSDDEDLKEDEENNSSESSELILPDPTSKVKQIVCQAQEERVLYFTVKRPRMLLKLNVFASRSLGMRVRCSYDLLYGGYPAVHPEKALHPFDRKPAILCLDGGGVLGISSLKVLERIEMELQRRLDNPAARLVDCFDMIAGTSTGGIIALGLLIGMSVKDMINNWAMMSNRIFEGGSRSLFSGIFFEGYDVARLKNALGQSLGQRFLNSYKGPYCFVTATDVKTNPYQLFLLRNYTHTHLANPAHRGCTTVPVWVAAWASAAAPTFLRGPTPDELDKMGIRIFPEVQLCDGAMKANNPTLVALEEAARLAGKRLRQFIETDLACLLSVGTGQPTLKSTVEATRSGSVSTFQILLNAGHLLTSATTVHREVLRWMGDHEHCYYRFNVPGIGDIPIDAIDKNSFDIILRATNDYLSDEKYFDIRRLGEQLAARWRV